MMPTVQRALLIVMSAPSGAGKTTLCRRLLEDDPRLACSISCTTRAPRPGETDGAHYYFLSEPEFARRAEAGYFLEHAEVHGHRYGTPRGFVEATLAEGRDVLLNIDVQGAARIRTWVFGPAGEPLRAAFVDVFVTPPSLEALAARLGGRGQDAADEIAKRLHNAAGEMRQWRDYRYLVVNDALEDAVARLRAIRLAEHCRVI